MKPTKITRTSKPTVFIFKNLQNLFLIFQYTIILYSIFEAGLFMTGHKDIKVKSNEKKTPDKRLNFT